MNSQNNMFVITSTINTFFGLITPDIRFKQTLETIQSIRNKNANSTIVLIENSFLPNEPTQILIENVDYFINISDRKICQHFNANGIKGAGESYMLLTALNLIEEKNITPKRIFKISGRYRLSDEFDESVYDDKIGTFCFKTRDKNEQGNYFLHSRMWSACGLIKNEMGSLMSYSLDTHLKENITIEEAIYKNIDLKKLIEFDRIYCEGYIAPWNILIKD